MDDKKINWKKIIITALMTGAVTIMAGMILFNLQTKKPKLVYDSPETSPFQGAGKNFAIYNVVISNTGGTNIEEVVGVVQFPDSFIDELKVTAPLSLNYSSNFIGDTLSIEIPNLNPTESISVSILVTSQSDMKNSPVVSVRGMGISGVARTSPETGNLIKEPLFTVALIVSLFSIFSSYFGVSISSVSVAGLKFPFPRFDNISGRHYGDQNKILSYLCGLNGLVEEMDEYLVRDGNTDYWSEADRFGALGILTPGSNETEKRKKVLLDLNEYTQMAVVSKAIVHYNIARIAFSQNNTEEAKKHLTIAQKIGGKIILTRLNMEKNLNKILDQEK